MKLKIFCLLASIIWCVNIHAVANDNDSTASQPFNYNGYDGEGDKYDDDDVVYMVVEKMPEFPGGPSALYQYLKENVVYPAVAAANNIQGRVLCQFIVEKDGSITDVVVVRSGGDASLDNEAMRVIQSMPKWNPGMQRGKVKRVKYTVPISFRLPDPSRS